MTTHSTHPKARENRLRRMAERQGLAISKSRVRDPRALEYDKWVVVDSDDKIVFGADSGYYDLTLDDVEAYLSGEYDEES